MRNIGNVCRQNKKVRISVKLLISIVLFATIFLPVIDHGMDSCFSYRVYDEEENLYEPQLIENNEPIFYPFQAKGNILSYVYISVDYIPDATGQKIQLAIQDEKGNTLQYKDVSFSEYISEDWGNIEFNLDDLKRGGDYFLKITFEDDTNTYSDIFIYEIRYAFTYRYITFVGLFEYILRMGILLLLVLVLCLSVFKMEIFIEHFHNHNAIRGLPYAVYLSLFVTLSFNPLSEKNQEVLRFKRIMGEGLVNNIDISRTIANFNHWFILFSISFVLFFLLVNYYLSRNYGERERKIIGFLDHFIILAVVELGLRCIPYFSNQKNGAAIFHYTSYLLAEIFLAAVAYLVFHLSDKIDADGYAQIFLIAFSLAFPIAIASRMDWESGKLLLSIQFLLLIISILLLKLGKPIEPKTGIFFGIAGASIVFSTIPFVTSFYIELINIFNQYGVFVSNLNGYYIVTIEIVFAATICFSLIAQKRNWSLSGWKRWAYPVLIFGIVCLSCQIPLENTYDAHLFETANSSILISDYLNFGSIPLVEHYGGHMMSAVWEGLIYALLNNDPAGAIFSPYSGYVSTILAVLFFYCIKYIWNEDLAFLTTLVFPFYGYWSTYGLSMLVCLAVLSYIKKNTYFRAAIVWLAFIWCAIYRLDLGFAVGFGCVVGLCVYIFIYKNQKALRQLAITLASWGIVGFVCWSVICLAKGIQPINRLKEFLFISLSNINWAYGNIGNAANTIFAWAYLIVPLAVCFCLIWAVFIPSMRKQGGDECWMILLIFGFSYLANFPRGLVRHSLVEMQTRIIFWSAYIVLAIFISLLCKKKTIFLPVFTLLILCNTLFVQDNNFVENGFVDAAVSRVYNFTGEWTVKSDVEDDADSFERKTYWEKIADRKKTVTRANWAESLKDAVEPYRLLIDSLLKPDETFADFSNVTFLYSAINRRNPVYVSQSPLQLSGEFSQEMFIREMEGIPIVLMPPYNFSLDGIADAYRYYKVSEYIYQHYIPLCKCDDKFAVWCMPERYDEMKKAIDKNSVLIDYGYDGPTEDAQGSTVYTGDLHNYNINQLPRIWAETDTLRAVDNKAVTSLNRDGSDIYVFDDPDMSPDEKGNYLLVKASWYGLDETVPSLDDDETDLAVIKLGVYENGRFTEKYKYWFTICEGTHDYLIRISTDYYWYLGGINAVLLDTDIVLHDVSMSILEGD